MTVPLELSPDYIRMEDREAKSAPIQTTKKIKSQKSIEKRKYEKSNIPNQSKEVGMSASYFYSMKAKNPVKYRFMLLYGQGDLAAGMTLFNAYWDRVHSDVNEILIILKKVRDFRGFSEHLGIHESLLAHYSGTSRDVGRRRWDRLLTMRQIVREFDGFMESRKVKET